MKRNINIVNFEEQENNNFLHPSGI